MSAAIIMAAKPVLNINSTKLKPACLAWFMGLTKV
jgi:hypothetical protein